MLTRLPRCSLVPALLLEAARSKLDFLFRMGSKVTGRSLRCSFRLQQRVLSKTASTNIILRCTVAGTAEKKSSFPSRVCSCPHVVHPAFFAPSSYMVSNQCPIKGQVVASVCGTTLMVASLTLVRLSRCALRASAIASNASASSHSAVSATMRRIWTGCESSPASFPTRSESALARVFFGGPDGSL